VETIETCWLAAQVAWMQISSRQRLSNIAQVKSANDRPLTKQEYIMGLGTSVRYIQSRWTKCGKKYNCEEKRRDTETAFNLRVGLSEASAEIGANSAHLKVSKSE
jgi:hypothetical protein